MISALIATFVLGVQSLEAIPYHWRKLPLSGSPVTSIALPAKGRRTFVAAGAGFTFRDLSAFDRIPMERVTGVAIGDFMPETVVSVGRSSSGGGVRFSLDGGEHWRPCPNPPALQGGSVAVSSTGMTWVWSAPGGAQRTEDYGFTWSTCSDLPKGARVVADRVSTRLFYSIVDGRLYVSDDGARSFTTRKVDLPEGDAPVEIVPAPGRVGELWLVTKQGLYRELPGRQFARVPGVTDPSALSFGIAHQKNVPGPLRFSIFLEGRVEGRTGLYRSNDEGGHWSVVGNFPMNASMIAGDPSHEDRIFVVVEKEKLFVGQP